MSWRVLLAGVCSLGWAAMAGCGEGGAAPTGRPDLGAVRDAGGRGPASAPDGSTLDPPASCVHSGPPVLDPAELPPCPMCSGGRCLPGSLVSEEDRGRLADCDAERKCVPDLFIETGGDFLLATCTSVGGAEGRCASTCLPDVAASIDSLPQGSCAGDERCAPCFHPATGEDTGVCHLACDTGPATTAPPPSTPCCGGAGTCLPEAAIPAAERARLGPDTCPAGGGLLCAPTSLTDDSFRPATCRSIGSSEGRCMPECLPAVAEDADRLPAAGCDAGERCVPCFDPIDGTPTGACTVNGDAPVEPPFTFPTCCEEGGVSRGTCVPAGSVPADRREDLDEEECPEDEGYLCVPTVNLEDPDRRNVPCTTEGGLFGGGPEPGACVLECIVGFRSLLLGRSTCASYEVCAPCMDPFTGDPTGACD